AILLSSASRTAASWQHRAKPGTEQAEVEPVDDAVAVEIEVAQIAGIPELRTEGVFEEAEVESIDRLISVDVAEHAIQALRIAEGVIAGHLLAVRADLRG